MGEYRKAFKRGLTVIYHVGKYYHGSEEIYEVMPYSFSGTLYVHLILSWHPIRMIQFLKNSYLSRRKAERRAEELNNKKREVF